MVSWAGLIIHPTAPVGVRFRRTRLCSNEGHTEEDSSVLAETMAGKRSYPKVGACRMPGPDSCSMNNNGSAVHCYSRGEPVVG